MLLWCSQANLSQTNTSLHSPRRLVESVQIWPLLRQRRWLLLWRTGLSMAHLTCIGKQSIIFYFVSLLHYWHLLSCRSAAHKLPSRMKDFVDELQRTMGVQAIIIAGYKDDDGEAHPSVPIHDSITDNTMTICPWYRLSGCPPDYTQWTMISGLRTNIGSPETSCQPIQNPILPFWCFLIAGKEIGMDCIQYDTIIVSD